MGFLGEIKAFRKRAVARLVGQRGFSLLEVIVALGILGFIGVAFMSALGSAVQSQGIVKENVRGENLVRAQLEDIRNQTYLASYTSTLSLPPDYSISIDTQPYCTPEPCTSDDNIQKNTVKVSLGGKLLVSVEDLKARR